MIETLLLLAPSTPGNSSSIGTVGGVLIVVAVLLILVVGFVLSDAETEVADLAAQPAIWATPSTLPKQLLADLRLNKGPTIPFDAPGCCQLLNHRRLFRRKRNLKLIQVRGEVFDAEDALSRLDKNPSMFQTLIESSPDFGFSFR